MVFFGTAASTSGVSITLPYEFRGQLKIEMAFEWERFVLGGRPSQGLASSWGHQRTASYYVVQTVPKQKPFISSLALTDPNKNILEMAWNFQKCKKNREIEWQSERVRMIVEYSIHSYECFFVWEQPPILVWSRSGQGRSTLGHRFAYTTVRSEHQGDFTLPFQLGRGEWYWRATTFSRELRGEYE